MSSIQYFELQPFTAGPMTDCISISGYATRQSGVLQVAYQVQGALDCVDWLGTFPVTGRCHELWRKTCFEFFLGMQGDSAYWEVNLSPNGCWNMYRFTDYRTGMREEVSVDQPVCRVVEDGDLFSLRCTIDCGAFLDDSADLELAVSSIIQDIHGSISYWAIDHNGLVPDFHNRASFSRVLPGVERTR